MSNSEIAIPEGYEKATVNDFDAVLYDGDVFPRRNCRVAKNANVQLAEPSSAR